MQDCFILPGPPNFFMSLQKWHSPHSVRRHASHLRHRVLLRRAPAVLRLAASFTAEAAPSFPLGRPTALFWKSQTHEVNSHPTYHLNSRNSFNGSCTHLRCKTDRCIKYTQMANAQQMHTIILTAKEFHYLLRKRCIVKKRQRNRGSSERCQT